MKNKSGVILIIAIVILVIGGAVFLLLNQNSSSKNSRSSNSSDEQQVVKEKDLKAEDIGLILEVRPDNKAIIMEITRLDGIQSLEYEATYERDVDDRSVGGDSRVMDGTAPSQIEVKESDNKIRREILLGTCSKNVCRYHKGVKEVSFEIRVNLKSGEVGKITQKITL